LVAVLLREVQMSMPFERFDQGRQERDQPFGIDLIGCFPREEQGLLDL
jgi:hypothetical protein